jgi:radical SAM protein with 4Fe4S-binding SPASM domain
MIEEENKTEEQKLQEELLEIEKEEQIFSQYHLRYEDYRKKWEVYPRLGIIERIPINLYLEPTSRCNLRCRMCWHEYQEIPKHDINLEFALKVIHEFAHKGGYSIKFSFRGEPLLYRDLHLLIRMAKKKNIIETLVNTNGMLLTAKRARELINAKLDRLIFSIDSCNEFTYSVIRRHGDFNKVLSNLLYFKEQKEDRKPILVVHGVKQSANQKEIESGEFLDYWSPIADLVTITHACHDYSIEESLNEEFPSFFCNEPFRSLTVRADGLVQYCCNRDDQDLIVGDARTHSIEDIWKNEKMNEIREKMSKGNAHLIPGCNKCYVMKYHYSQKQKDQKGVF